MVGEADGGSAGIADEAFAGERTNDATRRAASDEFAGFYADNFRSVIVSVYAATGDYFVAEEATQEAFARALSRWDRLSSTTWARGWVSTTALNHARRLLGKRVGRREPVAATRRVEVGAREESLDLWLSLRRLSLRQQQVTILYYLLGLSVAECAQAMRCREGTVKTHLHRARAFLLQHLKEDKSTEEGAT